MDPKDRTWMRWGHALTSALTSPKGMSVQRSYSSAESLALRARQKRLSLGLTFWELSATIDKGSEPTGSRASGTRGRSPVDEAQTFFLNSRV